jgi:hypothetical protein
MFIKKPMDLLLVNVCCIGAVGFYYNLIQPDIIAFTTSLYKIDWMIEEKESLAQKKSKLIDEELVEQKLPY